MQKLGQTKMANGKNKLVSKVPSVLPVLIQHSKHPGRGHSPSMRRRWKESRRSSWRERFGSALKCSGICLSGGWFAIKAAMRASSTVDTSAANTKASLPHLNSINIFVQRLALMDIQTKSKSMLGRRTPTWCQKDADTMDFGIQ